MATQITLEIVTPEGLQLREQVSELTAPSVQGEFGALPGHRPVLAALQAGLVHYRAGGEDHVVAVGQGFVEVHDDHAVLLTDRFLRKAAIDPVVARLELKDADQALDAFDGDPTSAEYRTLVEREVWAAVQLELYGDPPPPNARGGVPFTLVQGEHRLMEGVDVAAVAAELPEPDDDAR